ncbi:MAG: retroviral-like aspartic protease family protein [Chloroflexi bacterium]|nr:retroviral-like aspartic protease family protein [Chloroflexota bacterium]
MTTLDFDDEYAYRGDKIILDVRIPAAPRVPVRMTLDTGASASTLNHTFLDVLGINDVTTGRAGSLVVANGAIASCWIHDVEPIVFGRTLRVEAAFAPGWDQRNLLGMRGFMDQLTFAVDHRAHRLYLKWHS